MRSINERLLLDHIRRAGELSRADLARASGLSKPTVSAALANLERHGLAQTLGVRTGVPGPAAALYRIRPEAGFVLGLDVGSRFLRGAVCDLTGGIRSRRSVPVASSRRRVQVAELVGLAARLCEDAELCGEQIGQTVICSPGVYDPQRDTLLLAPTLSGWERSAAIGELRERFGDSLVIENDVDAAALAEQAHGHGHGVDSFALISVGTGVGMGLVLGGRLHRGAHGVAGEIGYLPFGGEHASDSADARRRGSLEAGASAAGVVRAARRSGIARPGSAQRIFAAAARGGVTATAVVAAEAELIARVICSVVAVCDPALVVLGGGIGQADGFIDAVAGRLEPLAPVHPELRVSALGVDAVVDGALASGADRLWERLSGTTSALA